MQLPKKFITSGKLVLSDFGESNLRKRHNGKYRIALMHGFNY